MAERTINEQLAEQVGAGDSKIIAAIFGTLTDENEAKLLLAAAPLVIFSVPSPEEPTARPVELTQADPAPLTVTAPMEPDWEPTLPVLFLTTPPLLISSVPLPWLPTISLLELVHVDPTPSTANVPVEPDS